jgi:hypothetical protein
VSAPDVSPLLDALKLPHLIVEGDCWFSCPAARYEDGRRACCNDNAGDRCNCGADEHNARVEELRSLVLRVESAPPAGPYLNVGALTDLELGSFAAQLNMAFDSIYPIGPWVRDALNRLGASKGNPE